MRIMGSIAIAAGTLCFLLGVLAFAGINIGAPIVWILVGVVLALLGVLFLYIPSSSARK